MGLAESPWQTVVSAALIGTDRQPFTLPAAPGALGQLLPQLSCQSTEATLLTTAATLSLHHRAGWLPENHPVSAREPANHDDLPRCSPRAARFLQQMLQGQYTPVLPEWLAIAATVNQRVPELSLPELLDLGKQRRDLRAAILPVLGQRGRWLATQNPDWSYAVAVATEEDWETGSAAARLLYLQDLRSHHPDRARELLQTTWSQEAARDRAKFLETLRTGLSMADEPFLEETLGDSLTGTLRERSKDVRRIAADLLASLPDSRLCQRMAERLKQYVTFMPKGELEFSLPQTCDAELQRDGIEPKPKAAGIGERTWWLQQIISAAPLSFWDQSSGFGFGEWQEVLINGWKLAVQRQRNQRWAETLLNGFVTTSIEELRSLLDVFPMNEQEPIVIRLIRHLTSPIQLKGKASKSPHIWGLLRAIAQTKQPWGKDLSTIAFSQIKEYLVSHETVAVWEFHQLLEALALCVSPALLAEADDLHPDAEKAKVGDRVDKFLATLQFRQDIQQAFEMGDRG